MSSMATIPVVPFWTSVHPGAAGAIVVLAAARPAMSAEKTNPAEINLMLEDVEELLDAAQASCSLLLYADWASPLC